MKPGNSSARDVWGTGPAAMEKLCAMFPTLRDAEGTSPWDADKLLRWLCTSSAVTAGGDCAARFVLQVWNSTAEWKYVAAEHDIDGAEAARPFNVVEAMGRWDDEHQAAFRAWVEMPFFP